MIEHLVLAIRIAIYAVATYRFTLLFYEEDGPWHIFDWLRAKAGIFHTLYTEENESGKLETKVETTAEGFWAELLNCPYCLCGWFSIVAVIGLRTKNKVLELIALWGCVWGVVHYLLKRLYY